MKTIFTLLVFTLANSLGSHATPPPVKHQQITSPDQVPEGLARSDWSSIRAAYEAGRHAFQPVENGWQARNPRQQWTTKFDGRGFLAEPRGGGWQWGLELQSYGFGDEQQRIGSEERKPAVQASGARLTYQWDATVQEWFVNDQRGLEHGFTVQERPMISATSAEAPLSFTLNTRGTLHPSVSADALGVLFLDASSATVINYTGLKVTDADGKVLTAYFEPAGNQAVRLLVKERGARYPLTIDPVAQQAYLKPSGLDGSLAGDHFGSSVSVSGDTVVIGANGEDSGTTGVNSLPNETATDAGAAYVFVRNGTSWVQQAYLKPAAVGTTQAQDFFGHSVSISGDTVVVGAWGENSSSTGVNSTPNENAGNAGAAYVFVRNGTTWVQQAYLKPALVGSTQAGDNFGISVAVSGNTVVVGAYAEASSNTGINNGTFNEAAALAGAAYVFTRTGTAWSQQAYLKPASVGTTQAGDFFGSSVSVSGDTVVVGAIGEDGSATTVNGTINEASSGAGAAYVFARSGATWVQQAYLKPAVTGGTQTGDQFGTSVSVSGDTVVVGAPGEDSGTTGVNSTPNESTQGAGAAYVFTRNGTTWAQQAYLKPAAVGATQAGDSFGNSVAVSGDTVVVAASQEDGSGTGVNSPPNENAANAGSVYVFSRSGPVWTQQAYLKPAAVAATQAGDSFGFSVAVADGTVIVGAFGEDSAPSADDHLNEGATDNGAAYVFLRSGTNWTQQAYLKPAGTAQIGDQFGVSVAVDGNTAIIGANAEDSSSTGVNSVPNKNAGEAGAAYIFVRISGVWTQQAYLKPAAVGVTQLGDFFGSAVALAGDTAVVGAFGEDSSSTGVNSTPNEGADGSGAAYIFVRNGGVWTQQAHLKPLAVGVTQAGDQFGYSVAISGNTVVVGAHNEDSNTAGVNSVSNPNEDASLAGAAYVFVRSGTNWTQQAYLKPAAFGSTQVGDEFGCSVAISGETLIVGAKGEDSNTTGVNSTPDEGSPNAGAAYVFVRSGTNWTQQAYLKPAAFGSTQVGDEFGCSVAISGDTLVVGASNEDSGTTGVNGVANEGAASAGAAYVFLRSGTIWTQQAYLKPGAVGTTQAGDQFGTSVAVAGDTVVVGAQEEDSSTTGVNSTPNENDSTAGAAYVFARSGGVWAQQMYLKPAAAGTTQLGDRFGLSVALAGDVILVGALLEDSSSSGVNSPLNESANESGAAYVYPAHPLIVQQPAGTGLIAGVSIIDYTLLPLGTSVVKTFAIGNSGSAALAVTGVSVVGGNAGDFAVNTAGMLTSVPGGGSTTFTVTLTPSVASARTTTLRIVNSDPFDGIYDVTLSGFAISFTNDTDGDGLNDASELQLAALGFDWQVSQPSLVNTLFSNATGLQPNLNAVGFFTATQVQAINVDTPLIQRDPGTGLFTLTVGLQKSINLMPGSFLPFPFISTGTSIDGAGKIQFEFTSPDNAAFFRLEAQ